MDSHPYVVTKLYHTGNIVVELGKGCLGAHHVVAGTRVQVPSLLLVGAHMSEVDLGAWFVEVDSL